MNYARFSGEEQINFYEYICGILILINILQPVTVWYDTKMKAGIMSMFLFFVSQIII